MQGNTGLSGLSGMVATNTAPVVGGGGTTLAYVEGDAASAVAPNFTFADAEGGTVTIVFTISANYQSDQDVLSYTNAAGFVGTWNAGAGTMTLVGPATAAQDQGRLVKYANSKQFAPMNETTRTVSIQATDSGGLPSNTVTVTITVQMFLKQSKYSGTFWQRSNGVHYQDSARTTLVAANNDPIGSITEEIGGNHGPQATSGRRALYKTGIQNGYPGILYDGTDDFHQFPTTLFQTNNWTWIFARTPVTRTDGKIPAGDKMAAAGSLSNCAYMDAGRIKMYTGLSFPTFGVSANNTAEIVVAEFDEDRAGETPPRLRLFRNGTAGDTNDDPLVGSGVAHVVGARGDATDACNQYVFEEFGSSATLGDTLIAEIVGYLNAKLAAY